MRGAIGGILTIKRADREDNASSASNDDGETWHTQSAEKMEILFEFKCRTDFKNFPFRKFE